MGAGVAVAADDGLPGLREPELRPDDVHDAALRRCCSPSSSTPNSAQLRSSCATWRAADSIAIGAPPKTCSVRVGRGVIHGGEGASGRRTFSPRSRSTVKACGEVTSWTRCRSMYSTAGRVGASRARPRARSQTFSNSVFMAQPCAAVASGAPPRRARRAACRRSRASPTGPAVSPVNRPKKACCSVSVIGPRWPSPTVMRSTERIGGDLDRGAGEEQPRRRGTASRAAARISRTSMPQLARQRHDGVAREAAEHRVRQARGEQHAVLHQEQVLARALADGAVGGEADALGEAQPLASWLISWLER